MIANYLYRTVDLRSNAVLEDIDLKGVTFTTVLNGQGQLSANLYVPDTVKGHLLENATIPGRTGLYVLRDNQPVWGGIIWKRDWDEAAKTYRLTCASWESYAYHVIQRLNKVYTVTDQNQIARDLITQTSPTIQSQTGIEPPDYVASGVIRQRYMYGYEFKSVGLEMEKLSSLINSFDYEVQNYIKPDGSFGRKYAIGYPRIGRNANISDPNSLTFDYPGNLLPFALHEDAETGAWVVWSVGAGEAASMLWSEATDTQYDVAGWPRLEEVTQYKSVSSQSTLDSHATNDLNGSLPPVSVWDLSLAPDSDVTINDFSVGDSAVFRIHSRRWKDPIVFVGRIAEISVTPPDPGQIEQVKLKLTEPVVGQDVTDDEQSPSTNTGGSGPAAGGTVTGGPSANKTLAFIDDFSLGLRIPSIWGRTSTSYPLAGGTQDSTGLDKDNLVASALSVDTSTLTITATPGTAPHWNTGLITTEPGSTGGNGFKVKDGDFVVGNVRMPTGNTGGWPIFKLWGDGVALTIFAWHEDSPNTLEFGNSFGGSHPSGTYNNSALIDIGKRLWVGTQLGLTSNTWYVGDTLANMQAVYVDGVGIGSAQPYISCNLSVASGTSVHPAPTGTKPIVFQVGSIAVYR